MKLTNGQKTALLLLAASPLSEKFYWTGGTLLSYHYLQHRYSEDLDFFADHEFTFEEINPLIQELKKQSGLKNVSYQRVFDRYEFLLEENEEKLRVEFVHYNHEKKPLGKRGVILGVSIDSIEDLAANKTMAYFDRAEPKDLFDIYFLIKKKDFTESVLRELVYKKFGVTISESSFWSEAFKIFPLLHTLKPLMFGEEEEQESVLAEVESYFRRGSEEFLKKNLK